MTLVRRAMTWFRCQKGTGLPPHLSNQIYDAAEEINSKFNSLLFTPPSVVYILSKVIECQRSRPFSMNHFLEFVLGIVKIRFWCSDERQTIFISYLRVATQMEMLLNESAAHLFELRERSVYWLKVRAIYTWEAYLIVPTEWDWKRRRMIMNERLIASSFVPRNQSI